MSQCNEASAVALVVSTSLIAGPAGADDGEPGTHPRREQRDVTALQGGQRSPCAFALTADTQVKSVPHAMEPTLPAGESPK